MGLSSNMTEHQRPLAVSDSSELSLRSRSGTDSSGVASLAGSSTCDPRRLAALARDRLCLGAREQPFRHVGAAVLKGVLQR